MVMVPVVTVTVSLYICDTPTIQIIDHRGLVLLDRCHIFDLQNIDWGGGGARWEGGLLRVVASSHRPRAQSQRGVPC